jgi:hypothetical protein
MPTGFGLFDTKKHISVAVEASELFQVKAFNAAC